MENLLQVILLGIIEGITEFLPISSTGHLLIAEQLGLGHRSEVFNIGIQAGAMLAVVFIYWRKLMQLASAPFSAVTWSRRRWRAKPVSWRARRRCRWHP